MTGVQTCALPISERFLAQQVQSGGIELPQFPQIVEGDESSARRMALLKQFLSGKAGENAIQGLLAGIRGN